MVKPITLFSSAAGLNTKFDPQRLLFGTKDDPGFVELSQAVNVSIDDRGLIEQRQGLSTVQSGYYSALFMGAFDQLRLSFREGVSLPPPRTVSMNSSW